MHHRYGGIIRLGGEGQTIIKNQLAREIVFALDNQAIILGIYSQSDDVQFRVFHLPHRFDSIVQNISEESIYIAILHEIQPPSICHAGNVDAQTVAGEHFACQHHVQRRGL